MATYNLSLSLCTEYKHPPRHSRLVKSISKDKNILEVEQFTQYLKPIIEI